MGSNLLIGMFAALTLFILVLIIAAGVRMHRKIAYNSAILRAHQQAMEAQKKTSAAKASTGTGQSAEAETRKKDTSGAGRGFRPTI